MFRDFILQEDCLGGEWPAKGNQREIRSSGVW